MLSSLWNLDSKVALVTGGSRGIGRSIAQMLAKFGASVAINYHRSEDAARAVADEIGAFGGTCHIIPFNVANMEQVQSACSQILDQYGKIDILVNNAGITRDQLFARMRPRDWEEVLNVNLSGAFHCSRCLAKTMMKQREGCIVNISSVAGVAGNLGQANYSAAKAGLIGLTKALAKELAPWRIRVNAVAPGYISTEMTEQLQDKVKDEIRNLIPLDRFGTPEDVAWTVAFLASPAADYLTGQVIHVNGGLYI